MKLALLAIATLAFILETGSAQNVQMTADEATQLATRALQLMESTAVAVPAMMAAAAPVKQNADSIFAEMQRAPLDPALTWRFMNQIKAHLALLESYPRPNPFPAAADRQITELRDALARFQQHFETLLTIRNQTELKHDADPNNLKRYAEADTKMLPQSKQPRVVFLGDSITDAWPLNEYFTGRDFVNRGIGGQTTLQMLARFRQDVLNLTPKAVVILGGTNDIEAGLDEAQIEDNLAMMADLAKAHGIKPVLASILPVSDYHKDADPAFARTTNRPPAKIQMLNTWLKNYCQTQSYVYIDYFSSMVDAAGQMQSDLTDDGLHPNAKGYRVMSPVALEAIGRAVAGQLDGEDKPESKRRRLFSGK